MYIRQKMLPTLPPLKMWPFLLNVQVASRATSEFIKYSQYALIWYQNSFVPKGVLRKSFFGIISGFGSWTMWLDDDKTKNLERFLVYCRPPFLLHIFHS